MFKVNGVTLKDKDGKTLYVPVNSNKEATYSYVIPAGTGGITASKKVRDYRVDAILIEITTILVLETIPSSM